MTTRDQLRLALAQSLMQGGGAPGSPLGLFGNLARQAAGFQLQKKALDDIEARKQAAQTQALSLLRPQTVNAGILDEGFEPSEVVRQQNPSRADLISVATNENVGSAFQNLAAQMYANELAMDRTRQQQQFTAAQSALERASREQIAADTLAFQKSKANRTTFEILKRDNGGYQIFAKTPGKAPKLVSEGAPSADKDEKLLTTVVAVDNQTGATFPIYQRGDTVFVGRGNGIFENLGEKAQNYTISTPSSQDRATVSAKAKSQSIAAIEDNLRAINQFAEQVRANPSVVGPTGRLRGAALGIGRFFDDLNSELRRFNAGSVFLGSAADAAKDLAGEEVGPLRERLKVVGNTLNVALQDIRRLRTGKDRLLKSEIDKINDLTNLETNSSAALLTKINELNSYIENELAEMDGGSQAAPAPRGQMGREKQIPHYRPDPTTGALVRVK